jgi:origin recognition complex subunit 1
LAVTLGTNGKPKRPKVGREDEERRFRIGDGVMVGVDGGDGVGILVGLYEEEGRLGRRHRARGRSDGQPGDGSVSEGSGSDTGGSSESGSGNGSGSGSDEDSEVDGSQSADEGPDGRRKRTRKDSGKPRMMAEVHWCFRRKDLPGVMKNLSVEDVSGSIRVLSVILAWVVGPIRRATRKQTSKDAR